MPYEKCGSFWKVGNVQNGVECHEVGPLLSTQMIDDICLCVFQKENGFPRLWYPVGLPTYLVYRILIMKNFCLNFLMKFDESDSYKVYKE